MQFTFPSTNASHKATGIPIPLFSLERLTILYVGTPIVLFLLFWFTVPFNFLFALIAVISLIFLFLQYSSFSGSPHRVNFLFLFIFALGLSFIGGVSGHFAQQGDYLKHNFFFDALVSHHWPLTVKYADGKTLNLVYYLGYYLVPSFLGSILGLSGHHSTMDFITFLWASLGLTLGLANFVRIFRLPSWSVLFFFGLCGLEFVGNLFTHELGFYFPQEFSWWAAPIRYVSMLTTYIWSPNHLLGLLLLTPLTLRAIEEKKLSHAITCATLSFFWNPFVTLGLLPFIFYSMMEMPFKQILRQIFLPQTISIVFGVGIPVLIFYSSRIYPDSIYFIGGASLFQQRYLLFILLEVLIFLPLLVGTKNALFRKPLVWISIALLLFIPFFTMGAFFDFSFRGMLVPRMILWGIVLSSLFLDPRPLRVFYFCLIFLLGIISPLNELYYAFEPGAPQPFTSDCRQNPSHFLAEMSPTTRQYLGSRDKNLFTHILLADSKDPIYINETWEGAQIGRSFGSNSFLREHLQDGFYSYDGYMMSLFIFTSDKKQPVTISFHISGSPNTTLLAILAKRNIFSTSEKFSKYTSLEILTQNKFMTSAERHQEFSLLPDSKTTFSIPPSGIDVVIHTTLNKGATQFSVVSSKFSRSMPRCFSHFHSRSLIPQDTSNFYKITDLHISPRSGPQ